MAYDSKFVPKTVFVSSLIMKKDTVMGIAKSPHEKLTATL